MIPKRHKMTIFKSFVNSKICYGIEIYGPLELLYVQETSNNLQQATEYIFQ